jgi:hypothetical protein
MMKTLWVIGLFLLVAGCAQDSGTKSPNAGGGGVPKMAGRDLTNRSVCVGDPDRNASLKGPGWESVQELPDGTEITTKMYFFDNSVSLFSFCARGGVSTYAQASAPATVTDTHFQILGSDTKKAEASENGATVTCEATLQASGEVGYTFQGPCLKMSNGSDTLVLPPR